MTDSSKNKATTVLTSFEIIQVIKERNGAGVTEIATCLELAKSTVHRHLSALKGAGYVVKEDGAYYLSLRFLSLGEQAQGRKRVYVKSREKVDLIAKKTGERAQFIVEEHGYAIYLHTALGEHAVKTDSEKGKRIPINTVSAGKAILAELPRKRVEEIIKRRGLPKRTENTVTDEEELFSELEKIRKQGYAINYGESTEGLRAISVPAKEADGTVVGAFGVSGPTHRFKNEEIENELIELLLGVANEFELDIKYQ